MKDNCANCEYFDGDAFCSLTEKEKLISGHIREPEYVVCSRHALSESSRHLAMLEAEDKAKADEERSLYRFARY